LFGLCRDEVQRKIKTPVSDLFAAGWVCEEFIELLIVYLMKQFKLSTVLSGFRQFLMFISQISEQCEGGVILMIDDRQQS